MTFQLYEFIAVLASCVVNSLHFKFIYFFLSSHSFQKNYILELVPAAAAAGY